MKRIVLLSVLGVLLTFAAQAQVQLALGLKGGLNFAKLDGHSTVTQNYGNRTGYHLGAYALIKIAKFGIQPELVYSKQGQSFAYNSQQNFNSNFDYINIPIMLKLYLAGGLNLQAGPQFGFLAGAKGDIVQNLGGGSSTVSTGQDIKNYVKSSDVSIGFGLGWDLPLGINLTARYNMGLSDINKYTGQSAPSSVTSLGTVSAKNQVIQFSIGYRLFKLGK